jgi:phage shock protein PspC (stress-responsive transcriptional regulator)
MTGALHTSRWQLPRLDRRNRWIGGVAAAIAVEIGVQPIVIRVSFVVLTTVGGWGLVLYAIAWATLAIGTPGPISPYSPVPKGASSTHRHVAVAMVVLGLVLGLLPFTSEFFRSLVWPVGFVLTGALIAWSRGQREQEGLSIVVRVVAGVVVAVGGLIAFAALQFNLLDTLIALVFGVAVVAGISVVAAPSVVRMAQDLDGERLERIRSDERARISAHLHDSVLQTLSLIQKNADDSARTVQLARQQERELRNWLYGTSPDNPHAVRLGPALENVATHDNDRTGGALR